MTSCITKQKQDIEKSKCAINLAKSGSKSATCWDFRCACVCVCACKCVRKLSPVSFSDIKLLLQCWDESQTVIKRDYVLEESPHDQKQICVQGDSCTVHPHAHVMLGCGFSLV